MVADLILRAALAVVGGGGRLRLDIIHLVVLGHSPRSGCEGLERDGAHTRRPAGESPPLTDEFALGTREVKLILRFVSSINYLEGEAVGVEGLDLTGAKAVDDALAGPRVGIVTLVGVGRRDLRICVCKNGCVWVHVSKCVLLYCKISE